MAKHIRDLSRDWRAGDAERLARFFDKTGEGWPGGRWDPTTPEEAERRVRERQQLGVFVTEEGGEFRSFCSLHAKPNDTKGAYVGLLTADPDYHGRGYGLRLTCPPHSPTPEQPRAVLDCYQTAILVHCPGEGDWRSIKEIVADLEREVFLAGHYKAFAFGSGPCDLCSECNLESCLHPQQARPAMEAAGIDVFATARGNGFPIEVVRDHSCPQNYYGLVLIE